MILLQHLYKFTKISLSPLHHLPHGDGFPGKSPVSSPPGSAYILTASAKNSRHCHRIHISKSVFYLLIPAVLFNKSHIERSIMGNQDSIPDKFQELWKYLLNRIRFQYHFIRNTGQIRDLKRDRTLRIDKRTEPSTISPFTTFTAPISMILSRMALKPVVSMSNTIYVSSSVCVPA